MEGRPESDNGLSDSSQSLLSSLLNGSDASSLTQVSDAKNFLSQILTGSQSNQANLQQVLSAAAALTQQQRLPTLMPTNSSSANNSQIVTTPTQPIPTAGRKRGRPPTLDQTDESNKKRRGGYSAGRGTGEKQSKGLRHFSQLVCEKVREKGITSYNEVADELVRELDEQEQKSGNDVQIDQKNIRRRVYDALNVLMAMNIISKEKKEIRWIGLPTNSVQECEHVQVRGLLIADRYKHNITQTQTELSDYEERITRKKTELHELVLQILTLKNLMKRNRERSEAGEQPTPNSAIGLPFILVNTNKQTVIDCSISSDKSEYVFNFDNTFELHQDVDILKKMGLECGLHSGTSTQESLALAKSILPKMLEPVLDEMAEMSTLSTTIIPPSPSHDSTHLSNPSTPIPSTTTTNDILTPLLNDSGPTYSSSPLGSIATTSPLTNSPNTLVAALSTLQHLQQISGQSSSLTTSFPNSIMGTTSGQTNSITLSGSNVTARPLPTYHSSPKPSLSVSISQLLKTQVPKATIAGSMGKSPGAKLVTVQPLPGNPSVADIIASLQQNVSTLLKQQGTHTQPSNNTLSVLNGLQPTQQRKQLQINIEHSSTTAGGPRNILTPNTST